MSPRHIPSLSALRAFEAAARHASFVRAADELNVSTSAISHQVRQLEAGFGVPLLHRGRIAPTAEGSILLDAVTQALATLADACERVGRSRRLKLTVSANAPFSALWLAPRIARFATRRPDIDIAVEVMDGVPDWSRDSVDLAILRTREDAPDDIFLLGETVFPVCSPRLHIEHPGDLAGQRLLQEEHLSSPELDWTTWFARLQLGEVPPGRLTRFSGFSLAISAAVAGTGVALGRAPLIDDELANGRLKRLFPGTEMPGSWHFVMRLRPGATTQVLSTLADFLIEESKEGSLLF